MLVEKTAPLFKNQHPALHDAFSLNEKFVVSAGSADLRREGEDQSDVT